MRLIIDIPEEVYRASRIVDVKYEDVIQIPLEVLANGTLLDDVTAEIKQICQDIDTCSHNEYENAVEQVKEIAYENVLDILDRIGKESESKE